jgi:tripartite ATP-independent transporter DctM subunit
MAIVGIVGITLQSGTDLWQSLGFVLWNTTNSFTLTAVPLFVLMGEIILVSGLSKRFYEGISGWLRPIPGGLAHSNILACAAFSAVSGSSTATAVTVGTVALPEMRSRGYDDRFVLGSLAAGGCLGILIPPSIVMIIYGSIVRQPIADLFMGGILPGALVTSLFMGYIMVRSLVHPHLTPREKNSQSVKLMLVGLWKCWPVVLIMAFILGGIYLGVVTPTEAAAVGCGAAITLGLVFREIDWESLRRALRNAVNTNAMLMFIIVGAQTLTFAIVQAGIAREVTSYLVASGLAAAAFFTLVCIMYVVMGCLIDGISMMLLTLPILYPAIIAAGFDGVWFGVVLVILIELGQITPPVGLNLVAIQSISGGKPLAEVAKGAFPYVLLLGVTVVVLYMFPEIVLYVPRLLR